MWHTIKRAAWDTETTGVNVVEDRIVTAALVIREDGSDDRPFNWVINPGVPCPVEASDIHGYPTERLQAEGSDPAKSLDEIAERLVEVLREGLPLVSFNGSLDYSILHFELLRYGLPTMAERLGDQAPVTLIDAYLLDKEVSYRKGSRKLTAVAEHYKVQLVDAHDATADALAALGVAEKIAERYRRVARMTPAELFAAQQEWAAEQAASYQHWLRNEAPTEKRDPNAVIDGSWPLKSAS